MVMEAVAAKVRKEDEDAQKEAEKAAKLKKWKSDTEHLKNL